MTASTLEHPAPGVPGRYSYEARAHDVALTGYGATVEQAFEAAAEAMFALISDPERVRADRTLPLSFIEGDDRLALVRWLELLARAAADHGMVFSEFHVQRESPRWWGCATGERRQPGFRPAMHVRHAASAVKCGPRGCEATCAVQYVPMPRVVRGSSQAAPTAPEDPEQPHRPVTAGS